MKLLELKDHIDQGLPITQIHARRLVRIALAALNLVRQQNRGHHIVEERRALNSALHAYEPTGMDNTGKTWQCHRGPLDRWCDKDGLGGFKGHTCEQTFALKSMGMKEMTDDELADKLRELNQKIADYPGWGAGLAALDEYRKDVELEMVKRQNKALDDMPQTPHPEGQYIGLKVGCSKCKGTGTVTLHSSLIPCPSCAINEAVKHVGADAAVVDVVRKEAEKLFGKGEAADAVVAQAQQTLDKIPHDPMAESIERNLEDDGFVTVYGLKPDMTAMVMIDRDGTQFIVERGTQLALEHLRKQLMECFSLIDPRAVEILKRS